MKAVLLLGVVLLAAAVQSTTSFEDTDLDWLLDEQDDELLDLPPDAARGFHRSLLAPAPVKVVTIGYSATATVKVPANAPDALPYFNSAMQKVVANGGGILQIGTGTFILSGQFAIKCSKCKIKGAGMTKTVLKLKDYAPKFSGVGFVTGYKINSVTISDLTLDGNKLKQTNTEAEQYGRYGLYISPNENLVLNKLKVVNFQQYGIDPPARNVEAGVDYTKSKKRSLTVTNCVSSFNNYDGYIFDTVVGVVAVNNTAEGNGRYGMNLVTGTWNALVMNNVFRKNGYGATDPNWKSLGGNGCGVATDSNMLDGKNYISTNIVYKKNIVIDSKRGGFCSKLSKNVEMTQNTIQGAAQCAWLYQNIAVKFTQNKCVKTTAKIINQENAKAVVSGNTCDGKPC